MGVGLGSVVEWLLVFFLRRWLLSFCWHPQYVFGSLALPLCGAAPTFLCRRKEK
jgi:hypothetical protein